MANSLEDIANQVLRSIGVRRRVAAIYEGSEAAKAFLDIYGQTRDELIRSKDWPIARRTAPLVLLKGPPPPGGYNPSQPWDPLNFPPPGWLYEYGYPVDMIELGAIIPPPFLWPDRDPRPAVWRIDNDGHLGSGNILIGGGSVLTGAGAVLTGGHGISSSGTKVILTNVAGAVAIYRAQVTDPSQWDALFTQTLISLLSAKLSVALAQNVDLAKAEAAAEAAELPIADKRRG